MEKNGKNVVLFPFMAESHIIPFLALSQQLHQKGYTVTIINTPLNIKKLHESLPPTTVKLAEIPFNSSDHGLPPESENTDILPYNLAVRLLQASVSLKAPLRNLLFDITQEQGGETPLCVISDLFFGWAADVAHELGIFHAIFSISGGFGMACYCSVWLNFPHKNTENVEFQLPDFPEAGTFHITQLTAAVLVADGGDPFTDFQRWNIGSWRKSDGLLFNTVEEVDRTGLMYFRREFGIPVWGIGPLLFSESNRATISAEECTQWMDRKEVNSVIYICFGSNNTISASQMKNLARALEASGRNFVWVVRPPLGFDINAEFVAEQWLPEGFVQRIRDEDRGMIVEKWAPQVEILSHESIGAFMSHCGWKSVLESLKNGVPLIGWPMSAEQFYNAKLLVEELGACVEVARGTNFEVRYEDITEKIDLVMGESERGGEIRGRVLEIKELFRDAVRDDEDHKGSSVKAMEEFLSAALLKNQQATI